MRNRPATGEDHDGHSLQAAAEEAERAAHEASMSHERDRTTRVLEPRHRIFLPQSRWDRLRSFVWSIVRATVFRWSPLSMIGWRNALLRLFGARVDRTAAVAPSARVDFPWNLTLGAGAVLCDHVIINCMGRVTIGAGSRVSQYSHLCAGTHDYRRPDMRIEPIAIDVGREVWIAADAFVGPGVKVGDGAVLAARSSAFHDLPCNMICVGEPAKAVKSRHPDAARRMNAH